MQFKGVGAYDTGAKLSTVSHWEVKKIAASTPSLTLDNNNPTQGNMILNRILNISFPCLAYLYLYNNGIESIESICRISIHSLQTLSLCNFCLYPAKNKIIRVSTLRKADWPKLKSLVLGKKPIT